METPPMVVEAEVHKNCCSEIDSDSEDSNHKVSDEEPVLDRKFVDLKETNNITTPSIFSVYEPKKTPKLTTETLDCDNFLVNQKNDSVLNTVRSWITKGKLPKRNAQSRKCKSVLGYANQYKKMFVDKETQLVYCKSKHSPKQICLP